MIDDTTMNSLFGAKLIDSEGEKVGTVKNVYVDRNSGRPLFAGVATGLFGSKESFVPLDDAELVGEEVRSARTKEQIKDAPRIDADGALTEDDEQRLWAHYEPAEGSDDAGRDEHRDRDGDRRDHDGDSHDDRRDHDGHDGHSARVPHSDGDRHDGVRDGDDTTESASSDQVTLGDGRLRRDVVTDEQTVVVPVQREEIVVDPQGRVVTEPVDAPDVAAPDRGAVNDADAPTESRSGRHVDEAAAVDDDRR